MNRILCVLLLFTSAYSIVDAQSTCVAISETDNGIDGTIENISIETYTYNSDGTLAIKKLEIDNGNDGSIDFTGIRKYQYDQDNDNDGIPNDRLIDIYVNDATGKKISNTSTIDNNVDGTVEFTSESTYTYDSNGNEIKWIIL